MSVCPASRRGRRALRALPLLLFCLLATAGCAARGRSAVVPTATPTATPAPVRFLAVPTFTPTVTPTSTVTPPPTLTPSAQAEGVYGDLAAHHHGGSYRLRRRGDLVEADLVSTLSPVQTWAQPPGPALFTLPPEFRPPFSVWRRGVGQPVRADGSPDPASPEPRPFRLQLEPDGRVHYLDHPAGADLGYLAYALHLTWGTTAAANDLAVLQILAEVAQGDLRESGRMQFADGRLTQLELDWIRLTALPPELGQLHNLRSLSLAGNELANLPPELGQLQHLKSLSLRNNQLTALPPALGQLQNLTILDLSHNQLTTLPPELGQLQNLKSLNLSHNQLTTLPPEIGQLQYLTLLNLWGNQLTALPPELGQLQSLTYLDLRHNHLTALPPELGQLQYLTELYLYSNQLTALPPELGQLQHLKSLHLRGNQLTALPPELGQLQNLTLNLSENPLTGCLPAGWRDQGIRIRPSEHPPFCTE